MLVKSIQHMQITLILVYSYLFQSDAKSVWSPPSWEQVDESKQNIIIM